MTPFWIKSFKGKEALQIHSLNHNFNLEIGRQQRQYLRFSKGHHCHLITQKADILPLYGFQCSGPSPFHDAFRLQWDLNGFKVLRLQSHCSCSCYPFTSPCFSALFRCPAFWIQSLVSARKAPELSCCSLWLCSTKGCIIHNLLTSLPHQLPKTPLVRNAIIRRGGCFVTHTVSLKRFFPQTNFSKEIQRFSKATAK